MSQEEIYLPSHGIVVHEGPLTWTVGGFGVVLDLQLVRLANGEAAVALGSGSQIPTQYTIVTGDLRPPESIEDQRGSRAGDSHGIAVAPWDYEQKVCPPLCPLFRVEKVYPETGSAVLYFDVLPKEYGGGPVEMSLGPWLELVTVEE